MTASAAAARVRLGKPNNFDATAMIVEILAENRTSRVQAGGPMSCAYRLRRQVQDMYDLIDMCQQFVVGGLTLALTMESWIYLWRCLTNVTYTTTRHMMQQACEICPI